MLKIPGAALLALVLVLAFAGTPASHASEPRLVVVPAAPRAGEPVSIALRNTPAAFLPTYRYWRHEQLFAVDFDLDASAFGPPSPAFGWQPLPLGELAPGHYVVDARLHEHGRPGAEPQRLALAFDVAPPDAWGVGTVPARPAAHEPFEVFVHSAAWLDPQSVRASAADGVVRIDFEFIAAAPGASPPAGVARAASAWLAGLAPGSYRLEAWGGRRGEPPQRYFAQPLEVQHASRVVEFYGEALGHYFMAAGAAEVALLDTHGSGWKRTGQKFDAWLRWEDAVPGAVPVCRFYATGPNSHFYTADALECAQLRSLERAGRALAAPFRGWAYEGIAFHAIPAREGECPRGTTRIYRSYNHGGAANANHRFTTSAWLATTLEGWTLEGVAFCAPE